MKERPILFSPRLVREIRAGRKSQTRREMRDQPTTVHDVQRLSGSSYGWRSNSDLSGSLCSGQDFRVVGPVWAVRDLGGPTVIRCPFGSIGDRLWVREPWRVSKKHDGQKPSELEPRSMTVVYEAGGSCANQPSGEWVHCDRPDGKDEPPIWIGKYRHARFMPRWCSRITLEITDIRAEELHNISYQDAEAEGFQGADARAEFLDVWQQINGEESLRANPWVWAISFKVLS